MRLSFQTFAAEIQDIIDRNLFERYGDVQAFALNRVVHKDLTSLVGYEREEIIDTINQYVLTYGCYDVSMITDPQGKIVAINTVSFDGETHQSSVAKNARDLIGTSVADEKWFKQLKVAIIRREMMLRMT